ncbi:ABC transporter substrate-binding protein [Clostridium sp. AM58-1XD]|uniref:ABC transporter substrate-binding protein n=1 Tax=Clostridium sp. AM58-1XD TaxID=2292307 RepID=UPI000E505F4E|nr:ABC transporter substrate-binding protein [Clostridium sp. AM58-1XD]RGZ01627.1 ABC transporter substrate-binding protein [Clostridium sp. AM58-1XD]
MKKAISVALTAAMIAVMTAGCGGSSSKTPDAGSSSAATAESGTQGTAATGDKYVNYAAVDPQVALDPQRNTYSIIMKMTDNIIESLVTTMDDGTLEPTLITALPELSEDKLTYSFELKDGVKFHNGETVTSEDVKYSLERVVKMQKMASLMEKVEGYEALASGEADELTGIKVVDDTHFTITLTSVYTPFVSVLSTPYCAVYPKAACEEAGENWGKTVLIGTGPFKMDSYTTSVGCDISRFDDYHGEKAKLDGVHFKFIEDVNTQVMEYQKGNVDYTDLDTSLYPVYANNPQLKDQIHGFQPVGGYSMSFNVKTISDPKVREAISLSIDRQAICESILHGTATPASSYIPDSLIGHDDSLEVFPYDPEKAKQLLAEAGYPDGYDLRISVNTKYSVSVALATAVQEQAKAAGINVQIEQVDSAAWSDMKLAGGIDCSISNWYVDYNDPDSMLYPVNETATQTNSTFYQNDEFTKLMNEGIQTADEAERDEIYKKAEHILTREDWAVAPLYNETKYYLLNPRVTGFEIGSTFRTFFKNADIQ